jgi:hypothetical protein
MKILRHTALVTAMLAVTGCYSKELILQAEVVSMTKTDAAQSKALKVGDEIEEKWCQSEGPVYQADGDKKVGMADQVIYKAQGAKKADFITDVRVYRDNKGCALLTGKPATL